MDSFFKIKKFHSSKTVILLIIVFCSSSFFALNGQYCYWHQYFLPVAYAQYSRAEPSSEGPTFNDPNIKSDVVFEGLDNPTSMAFLGPNDILVLQKNEGTVNRIVDGKMSEEPLLRVDVGQQVEWGMLGIAISKNIPDHTYVFLYYTEAAAASNANSADSAENNGNGQEQQQDVLGNRLYRYELVNDQLVNPKLLLDLPATSPFNDSKHENNHDGGKVLIGPNDGNVYVSVGDVGSREGQAQNVKDGDPFDGTSGILRVGQNGEIVSDNPLVDGAQGTQNDDNGDEDGGSALTGKYYAYGIRNSFGIDFDPVTGKLWDTENGPTENDEINLVDKGFDSGWIKVQGLAPDDFSSEQELITLGGKGKYSDPEFVWIQPIGPTALKFLHSDTLGKQYENTIFTGDVDYGYLYNFKLDQERTRLLLSGPLQDKVADTPDELEEGGVIFGRGFGVITDMQVGPDDGYLYVLTYDGTIYRIYSSGI
ncbi:MAG: PQQ-dependent sugar dehydrogenase [Nitrososphaeraceae archaeon]|nr:PQQ-dependent sugar dehydrogenase [Nitrososphaeraceae archaeon]